MGSQKFCKTGLQQNKQQQISPRSYKSANRVILCLDFSQEFATDH